MPRLNSPQKARDESAKVRVAVVGVGVVAPGGDTGNTLATSFTSNGATHRSLTKVCEREIATTVRCATIGTVQQSFTRPAERVFIHGPEVNFLGQTRGEQAVGHRR